MVIICNICQSFVSRGMKMTTSCSFTARLITKQLWNMMLHLKEVKWCLPEIAQEPYKIKEAARSSVCATQSQQAYDESYGEIEIIKLEGGWISTKGYLDPEYYMSQGQRMTEKTDVYCFGVALLELITARAPTERGKHIVRLVAETIYDSKDNTRIVPGSKKVLINYLHWQRDVLMNLGPEKPELGCERN